MLRQFILLGLLATAPALAAPSPWQPEKVTFCSDGEFDWNSGQSLYDFVLLSRADGSFLISYLGVPHPSFEKRQFDNAWIKLKGQFSAKRLAKGVGQTAEYHLSMALASGRTHTGILQIDAAGNYTYRVTPAWGRETTKAGLCWDSLSEEPDAIKKKSRRR